MYDVPVLIWFVVLAGSAGLITTSAIAIGRGALATGAAPGTAIRLAAVAGGALVAWLVLAGDLASQHVFSQGPGEAVPWIGVGLAGALAGLLLASQTPPVYTAMAGPDAAVRLVAPQVFRVVGLAMLIMMLLGELPAVFALPAGLGDLAVGVAAMVLTLRAGRGRPRRAALVWFNVLGLADLVVAVGLGFLAAPGPYRLITGAPSTEPMTLLPMVLVPVVAVPLAAALHVVSLRRLTRTRPRAAAVTGAP